MKVLNLFWNLLKCANENKNTMYLLLVECRTNCIHREGCKIRFEDKSFRDLRKEKYKTVLIRYVGGWIRIDIFLFSIYTVIF